MLIKTFWHPVFKLDKIQSNLAPPQTIFYGNLQKEVFYRHPVYIAIHTYKTNKNSVMFLIFSLPGSL